jgi:hypothetical protein
MPGNLGHHSGGMHNKSVCSVDRNFYSLDSMELLFAQELVWETDLLHLLRSILKIDRKREKIN